MTQRRFPPPWTVEETDARFVVKDSSGQKLAYVYFEDEPGRSLAPDGILIERAIYDAACARCVVSVDLRAAMMPVVKSTGLPRAPETIRAATAVPCIPHWRPREHPYRPF